MYTIFIAPQVAFGMDKALYFPVNRTREPSLNTGSQAVESGFRAFEMAARSSLLYGMPAQTAPWIGSSIISYSCAEDSEPSAPKLVPCRYNFGLLSFGNLVQYWYISLNNTPDDLPAFCGSSKRVMELGRYEYCIAA